MKKTDLAYVAGIIDGEGHISICKNTWHRRPGKCTYRLEVSVTQKHRWLLFQLQFMFGGVVSPFCYKSHNYRSYWRWILGGKQAKEVLEIILPYLRLKKPQAEIAISFQNLKEQINTRVGQDNYRKRRPTDEERAILEAKRIMIQSLHDKKKVNGG